MILDDLTIDRVDDQGRTWYAPVTMTVKQPSQFDNSTFEFHEMPGQYWDVGENTLNIGQAYELKLTSKPKAGPRAKPGSMYLDVRGATPTGTMLEPVAQPQEQYEPTSQGHEPPYVGNQPRPSLVPPVNDDIQIRIEKGMAFNAAYTLMTSNEWPNALDIETIPYQLRELWAVIYHGVIEKGVPPLHYCYDHEEPYVKSSATKAWGHLVEGGEPCMEDAPEAPETNTQPPEHHDAPPF